VSLKVLPPTEMNLPESDEWKRSSENWGKIRVLQKSDRGGCSLKRMFVVGVTGVINVNKINSTAISSGVISANHWESNISYSTTSLSPCYCDVWYAKKNIHIELAALLLYHRKKHCKKLPLP